MSTWTVSIICFVPRPVSPYHRAGRSISDGLLANEELKCLGRAPLALMQGRPASQAYRTVVRVVNSLESFSRGLSKHAPVQ